MNATGSPRRLVRFGVFEVDLDAREVRKRGLRVRLPHQAFQVLQVLLEPPGRVVTREELRRALWPADTYVEFDRGLNNTISRLRDLLDDSPKSPRFIETIPRRGYQFIAPTEVAGDAAVPARTADFVPSDTERPAASLAPASRPWWVPAIGLAVLLALVGIGIWQSLLARPRPAPKSVAVLPLTYKGAPAEPSQDYLAAGMTDALIAELSQLGALRVTSETSSRRFAGTNKSLPEIARELGVESIVEGSVVREGDVMRVTVQLIAADTDSHLWSQTYTRGLGNLLALQHDIASAIAREVGDRVALPHVVAEGRRIDPEAYRLYVLGDQLRRKGTEAELYGAVDHFERALVIEPDYAEAYWGVGESWITLTAWAGSVPPREGFPKAKAAVAKALAIDPLLPGPYVSLAFLSEVFDWDLQAAEPLYKRALELSPNYALAHERYSLHLNRTGRQKEGVLEAQRAYELNPLSIDNSIGLGMRLGGEKGLAVLVKATQLDPDQYRVWVHLGEAYSHLGRTDEAIAAATKAVELSGRNAHAVQMLTSIYAKAGKRREADELLAQLEASTQRNAYEVGLLHLKMSHPDKGIAWLQIACRERTPQMAFMPFASRGAIFDSIRSDARFEGIVHCGESSPLRGE